MNEETEAALAYHRFPRPGKVSIQPTKPMATQRDLSLAYSPGVAAACSAIASDPALASELTSRANLVAVITNGSAVLGLGDIGGLASKPVMEGKACLFKKFAGIDVFDIELNENDPERLVDIIAAMEPTFGGINLEDIRAPQCFHVERKLRERLKIPVFHDDQHGTAIIVGAALLNALQIVNKPLQKIKLVCSGAGAAAIACLDQLVSLGVRREHIWVSDVHGVVYRGRTEAMDPEKERYAQHTATRDLAAIIPDADVFLGLSAGNVLSANMIKTMAKRPVILALANPDPEIDPRLALTTRPDAIIATGRSDYPNQVNNVLCFPFIFRGALDVGATSINEPMKLAALHAIAALARAEQTDVTVSAYGQQEPTFGPDFLIPRPFDPRLITRVAPAVAKAAMDSGVATRLINDLDEYRRRLDAFAYRSGNIMRPVFTAATRSVQRIAYAEGEDPRVLRAAQIVVDEKLAHPVLLGREEAIRDNIRTLNLRLRPGVDMTVFDPGNIIQTDPPRGGVSQHDDERIADMKVPRLAATLLDNDGADALICGLGNRLYSDYLAAIDQDFSSRSNGPLHDGGGLRAAMNLLMLPRHALFVCDTHVNGNPTAIQLADIAMLAADEIGHFGLVPHIGIVAPARHCPTDTAPKVETALALIRMRHPNLMVTGPIQADVAITDAAISQINLLILPNLDTANIAYNILRMFSGEGLTVGPILLGTKKPRHILSPTHTVRGIVNMTALAAAQAMARKQRRIAEP